MRTRLLEVSETKSLFPSEETAFERINDRALLPPLLAVLEVKSGWPSTISAGAKFVVGMEFQIRTRLLFTSVTKSLFPSEEGACGKLRDRALRPPLLAVPELKSGGPNTTSAA